MQISLVFFNALGKRFLVFGGEAFIMHKLFALWKGLQFLVIFLLVLLDFWIKKPIWFLSRVAAAAHAMTYERRRTTHKEYPVHVLEPLSKLNLIPKMKVVSFFTLLILLVGSFPVMVFSCWVSSKFPILGNGKSISYLFRHQSKEFFDLMTHASTKLINLKGLHMFSTVPVN